jgi:hypothetical protein
MKRNMRLLLQIGRAKQRWGPSRRGTSYRIPLPLWRKVFDCAIRISPEVIILRQKMIFGTFFWPDNLHRPPTKIISPITT